MKLLKYVSLAIVGSLFFCGCQVEDKNAKSNKRPTIRVTVKSDPPGATVFVDGKRHDKQTPVELTVRDNLMHMLELNYPGYEPLWRQIPASETGEDRIIPLDNLEMKKKTVPLILQSKPTGALVSLDNQDLGKTPRFVRAVPLGRHTAVFKFTGYSSTRVPIDLTREEYRVIKPTLESIMGAVTIVSRPGGAKVRLDGEPKGLTNSGTGVLKLTDVVEGRHKIHVEKAGYEDIEQTFLMKRHENMTITVPAMQAKPGSLTVTSEPSAANIYRGGYLAGRTPAELKHLPPGQVTLQVKKEGYESQTKPIRVLPGINKVVHFELVSNFGSLLTSTAPPGCSIIVDGDLKGESEAGAAPGISKPFRVDGLKKGLHTVIIQKAGYEQVTRQVLVQKGKNTVIPPVKLKKLWLPTHRLLLKGATKPVLVKVIQKTAKGYLIEEKEGHSTIRSEIGMDAIVTMRKID